MQLDGLVICRPRATDARVTEVLLTPAGLTARQQAWNEADRIYQRAFGAMADKDIVKLNQLLTRVFDSLGVDD